MKECSYCHNLIDDAFDKCPVCNMRLPMKNDGDLKIVCPKCGQKYKQGVYVCDMCGYSFASTGERKRKKVIVKNEDDKVVNHQKKGNKKRRSFNWGRLLLILFFIAVIATAAYYFIEFDKKMTVEKELYRQHRKDSINNVVFEKENKIKREKDLNDSIFNAEMDEIQSDDSVDIMNRIRERRNDSIRVDAKFTNIIIELSPTNVVLARCFDINKCLYFYADTLKPLFTLQCYDGVTGQTYKLIDNIQGKWKGGFTTPDYRSFIILCQDDIHLFGMAFKVNMYDDTYIEYKNVDDSGNKCYEVNTDRQGFYMKFGHGNQESFTNSYILHYDHSGNFIGN